MFVALEIAFVVVLIVVFVVLFGVAKASFETIFWWVGGVVLRCLLFGFFLMAELLAIVHLVVVYEGWRGARSLVGCCSLSVLQICLIPLIVSSAGFGFAGYSRLVVSAKGL